MCVHIFSVKIFDAFRQIQGEMNPFLAHSHCIYFDMQRDKRQIPLLPDSPISLDAGQAVIRAVVSRSKGGGHSRSLNSSR